MWLVLIQPGVDDRNNIPICRHNNVSSISKEMSEWMIGIISRSVATNMAVRSMTVRDSWVDDRNNIPICRHALRIAPSNHASTSVDDRNNIPICRHGKVDVGVQRILATVDDRNNIPICRHIRTLDVWG